MSDFKPTHKWYECDYVVWPNDLECRRCKSPKAMAAMVSCPTCAPEQWREIKPEQKSVWWCRLPNCQTRSSQWHYCAGSNIEFGRSKDELKIYQARWGARGYEFHFGPTPPDDKSLHGSSEVERTPVKRDVGGSIPSHAAITPDPSRDYRHLVGCKFQMYPNNKHCSCRMALVDGRQDSHRAISIKKRIDTPYIPAWDADFDDHWPLKRFGRDR